MSQLNTFLNDLMQAVVSAELEITDLAIDDAIMVEAKAVEDAAQAILIDADEYIFSYEDSQTASQNERINVSRLNDLESSISSFKDNLKVSAFASLNDVENSVKSRVFHELVAQKRDQMSSFNTQKLELFGAVTSDDSLMEDLKSLDTLYTSTCDVFNQWVEDGIKHYPKAENVCFSTAKSSKGPGLKLDRLSLPVFSGDVRSFARFVKEFENTVGTEYPDPKVKCMYLQNQCLRGPAKELVINLTDFDEVMERLRENYGKVSLTIDSVLREINELKLSHKDEANSVIKLCKTLQAAWDDLTAVNSIDEFCNIVTLGQIEGKLPHRLQILWAKEKGEKKFRASKEAMVALKSFLDDQRKIAVEVLFMKGKVCEQEDIGSKSHPKFAGFVETGSHDSSNASKSRACFRCGFTNHRVKDCKVPNSIKCRACGRTGHIQNACTESSKVKKCVKCGRAGHTQESCRVVLPGNGSPHSKVKFDDLPQSSMANFDDAGVKLPIEEVNTESGLCTVLWDSGSMLNLVSNEWVSKSGLCGRKCSLQFKVVDGSVRDISTYSYDICLISKDGTRKIVKAYGIDDLAANGKALNDELVVNVIESLKESVSSFEIANVDSKVELLLGSGCISDFPVIKHRVSDLCLMSSEFGTHKYIVVGNHHAIDELSDVNTVCHAELVKVTPLHSVCENIVSYVEDVKRDNLLNDFAAVEELGIRPPPICKSCKNCEICKPASQFLSLKEYRELNIIKTKLSYDEQGKFWIAGYPFLKNPSVLNDNFESAFKALQRRENKLLKNESLRKLYDDQVQDFVNRGVISKMSESELENWNGPLRYVDHHEVFKEGSTTPLRIVINSSFRDRNELSFNDILMKGPNVLTSLLEVLLRWRLYPVAFVGDVSKMYHNVKTGELEGNLRRMLWRNCEINRNPDIYCFNVVTFGDRPAGCIAVSALRATADMFSSVSEEASEILKRDAYMDDVVSGANSVEEATALVSDIEMIAAKGGFKFKKFQYSKPVEESADLHSTEKVLGVCWEPSGDVIKMVINLNHNKRVRGIRKPAVELEEIPFTRRVCLRLVNGIFDPMGLVSAVTVRLKILMKQHFVISTKYKKWDEFLDCEDKLQWMKVLRDVWELDKIHFSRTCVDAPYPSSSVPGKYSLVCFTDASGHAMCAVVYIRFESNSGNVSVGLLTAKTRVSPAKPETTPKLELCAALMGARLTRKVTSALLFSFETEYFLVDSKIVLGALNKGSLANDFTGNCVAEIRSKTEKSVFAWVQSEDNIADLGSRGAKPEKVAENSEWQKGPSWMYQPVEQWPIEVHTMDDLPIVGKVDFIDPAIDISKFSDLDKLHKHTALCLKFARSKGNGKPNLDSDWRKIKLTSEDFKAAELYWVKKVSESVVQLYRAGKLDSLRPVSVWEDDGKFVKVVTSGRLGELLKIGYDVEELTILDPSHPYTRLVLKHFHDESHCGDDRTVWKSRTKFWIPQARRLVKEIRNKCYRCKLLARRNSQQLMSPLPKQRVLPTPVWYYTSLDLFGPLEHVDMVRKRMKEKCWGVLFTCMVSRAVHLDLTQAYHTDALLQAIRRFMSLRGAPKEFLSDQGSQMVACSKEVEGMLELMDWNFVEGWCAKRSIDWKFVPPQGQHMNGVAESLVRVTKDQLKQTLEGKRLTFVETQTVLFEVCQVINSRPLGVYSKPGTDPLDGGPITPNHLLLGRATNAIPDLKFENVTNVKRMKFLNSIVIEFWDKWRVVVFHSLVPQFKWHKSQRNISEGDVVLLKMDEAKVSEYKLGQVVGVKFSGDGLVRSVKVRTVSIIDGENKVSYLSRPIHKLCVIVPVEEQ